MIDTKERRRAVIDFGKNPRGMGMPVPSGVLNEPFRGHVLNLYPGILPPSESFFFWRNRKIQGSSWLNRVVQSSSWKGRTVQASSWTGRTEQKSTWQKPTDADDTGWVPAKDIKDT